MEIVYVIFEWLLIIAFLGLLGALGWLAMTALKIKASVMKDAKRLYEPPVRAVKSLVATGKGIAQQESVRVRHMTSTVKVAAGAVKEASDEVKVAAEAVHFSELKPTVANAQNVWKVIVLVRKLSRLKATT